MAQIRYVFLNLHPATNAVIVVTVARIIPVQIRLMIVRIEVAVRDATGKTSGDVVYIRQTIVATIASSIGLHFHPLDKPIEERNTASTREDKEKQRQLMLR